MTERLSTSHLDAAALQRLHDAFLKQGNLIEAGWVSLRIAAVPPDAPVVQLEEMRTAFFAGAQHLFGSIMALLDPGEEPTDAETGVGREASDMAEGWRTHPWNLP